MTFRHQHAAWLFFCEGLRKMVTTQQLVIPGETGSLPLGGHRENSRFLAHRTALGRTILSEG
jgi:hypothetical protein